jgi:hypothetical protein
MRISKGARIAWNLALFGLLSIEVLRGPLLAEFGLSADSIVYPPQSSSTGPRSDFGRYDKA